MRRGRHRTALVITAIWVSVFVAAFLLAAAFADSDPNTDEASGAGALAGVAGALLTVLYLALSRVRSRAQVVDVLGAFGFFVVGFAIAIAVGAADGGLLLGGALAGVFLFVRLRRRPRAPRPPPALGRRCPCCAQLFRCDVAECPHCGASSARWTWHSGAWWVRSANGDWQWLDEAAGTWRWYADGSPSGTGTGAGSQPGASPPPVEPPVVDLAGA